MSTEDYLYAPGGDLRVLEASVQLGLFGFHESTRAPLVDNTSAVESAGTVILLVLAAVTRPLSRWKRARGD